MVPRGSVFLNELFFNLVFMPSTLKFNKNLLKIVLFAEFLGAYENNLVTLKFRCLYVPLSRLNL